MLVQEKAFLLSRIHHSDSSFIINCFTENYGYKTFILKGAKKKYAAYIQSMSPILITFRTSEKDNLQVLYQIDFFALPISIQDQINKTGILFFQNEILKNVLFEGQVDKELFEFLEQEYNWLYHANNVKNYMFFWLFECIAKIGFSANNYVDSFQDSIENKLFHQFKELSKKEILEIKISSIEKEKLLSAILHYYQLKIPNFKKINSISTFKEIWE